MALRKRTAFRIMPTTKLDVNLSSCEEKCIALRILIRKRPQVNDSG